MRTRAKVTEAIEIAEERMMLMRQIGEPGEIADALSSLAEMFIRRGEVAKAALLYQEALVLHRKTGNDLGVAITLLSSATGLW